MKLTARGWLRTAGWMAVCAVTIWLTGMATTHAQAVSTTTVQGTVYLANGQPAAGTLVVSWPTYTTAGGQLISAGQTTVTVGADGYVSVNLAPNQGATPAGEYYTAVFYKSDGTVSRQYWTVPAAAQASLAQVQAQVMPSAQAVQAVSKAYVDQAVSQALGSQLTASGGNLTGPLLLSGDPSQPLQAADKHYVDSSFSAALPLSGGTITGPASFNAAVTFGSSVTASSGMSFTGTGAAQTLTNLLPGAASDNANGMTLKGTSAPNTMAPKVSPMADIRANGAVIDGVTDIGPAVVASEAQCNAANGNSCTILLPCTGPNGCYWANGTDGQIGASGGYFTFLLQGNLHLQTTLSNANVEVNIIGSDGGTNGVQFASPNQTASITVPSTDHGVLGTAVTVTPTSGNFGVTQAFTPSTMEGLYANTWITIAGPLTCNITSLTRVSNLVTATLPSSCHIPPGVAITVAGVTDSTFNGTHVGTGFGPFTMLTSDYVKNTMTWRQSGQADATSTGGTITGLNEDTVENVPITSCTSTTCTATFYRSHLATDMWGVDGVSADAGPNGSHAQLLKNIAISAPGTALDAGGYNSQYNYVSVTSIGQCSGQYYNFPVSIIGSGFQHFDSDAFNSSCGPYSMHMWNQWNYGFTAAGNVYITNSFLVRGVKLDHGGATVLIKNSVCDQCYAGIMYDPNYYWNGNPNFLSLDTINFNDNPDGFPVAAIYQLFPAATNSPKGTAFASISKISGAIQSSVNDYFPQAQPGYSLKSDTTLKNATTTQRGVLGTYNDGRVIDGEIRGEGANMSPAVIPYATANIPTNPASWSATNCTVTPGLIGPDGTANAGGLVENFGNNEPIGAIGSLTPVVGDAILFGAWVYSPTPGVAATGEGTGDNIQIDNNGSIHFSFNGVAAGATQAVGGNEAGIINDWWHPVTGIAVVTSSDGTTNQVVNLEASCGAVKTLEYFDPWMMYVPASAGVPLAELQRWRTQLMHSYVPANATAGTLASDPNLTLNSGTIQLLPANPLPLGQYKNFAGSGSPSDTCNGTSGLLGVIENNDSNSVYKCLFNGTSYSWQQLSTGSASIPAVPSWLLWQGDGSAGAFSCTSGTCAMRGENWYSSVNIASGATAFLSAPGSGTLFEGPLTIRSTGTCTIAGTLSASVNNSATGVAGNSFGGGSGGGGGGGTAAGVIGNNQGNSSTAGSAGAASGGTGGNAGSPDARDYNLLVAGSGMPTLNFNVPYGGAKGGNGGSSGATGGSGGGSIVLDCAAINFTGTIDVSGANGGTATANNTGAGGGGGGGFVIMRSPNLTNSGTINVAGGSGGSCGTFTGCGAGGNGHAGWSEVFNQ